MKEVKVYYYDMTKYIFIADEYWDKEGQVWSLLPREEYQYVVSFFTLPQAEDLAACEDAFFALQRIEGPHDVLDDLGQRSMSMGDLLTIGNKAYLCLGVGFREVNADMGTKPEGGEPDEGEVQPA